MNKKELVEQLAKKAKTCSKIEAERVLNAFIDTVRVTLKKGKKVSIAGFGTFSRVKRKARNGINPQTGKKIKIPATKVAKFKVGSKLKQAVKK
ncbi:HU family DNA-binding protein [Patescibacteria group bacterium]|nr:HU family DNA-binding protein [Patescibacteria group bacterium]